MVSLEEAKEIANAAVGGVVLGQLDDVVPITGNYHVEVKAIVSKALDVIQDNYYLVPKVTFSTNDDVVDNPAPEHSIDYQLSEIWNKVSN
jgi:hypothetical protein